MTVGEPSEPPAAAPPPAMDTAPATPGPASLSDQELLDNFPVAKLTKLDELISNPRERKDTSRVFINFKVLNC